MAIFAREYLMTGPLNLVLRYFNRSLLRVLAGIFSIIACATTGFIFLYSIFAIFLHHDLSLNERQLQTISASSELVMYMSIQTMPWILSFGGSASFSLVSGVSTLFGYHLVSTAYSSMASSNLDVDGLGYPKILIGYCLIGFGNTSMYIGSVTNLIEIFKNYTGTAVAIGIISNNSSFMFARFLLEKFILYSSGQNDLTNSSSIVFNLGDFYPKIFKFYLVICSLNYFSSCVVNLDKNIIVEESEIKNETTNRFFLNQNRSLRLFLISFILIISPISSLFGSEISGEFMKPGWFYPLFPIIMMADSIGTKPMVSEVAGSEVK